jgi:hypothetical protein
MGLNKPKREGLGNCGLRMKSYPLALKLNIQIPPLHHANLAIEISW